MITGTFAIKWLVRWALSKATSRKPNLKSWTGLIASLQLLARSLNLKTCSPYLFSKCDICKMLVESGILPWSLSLVYLLLLGTNSHFLHVAKLLFFFSCYIMFNSLRPHGLQNTRLPCPSLSSGSCPNSCPLSQWCHSTISSSVTPFSSRPQSFPASGSFPMSQWFGSDAKVLGLQLQHQSFQWIFRTDFL